MSGSLVVKGAGLFASWVMLTQDGKLTDVDTSCIQMFSLVLFVFSEIIQTQNRR